MLRRRQERGDRQDLRQRLGRVAQRREDLLRVSVDGGEGALGLEEASAGGIRGVGLGHDTVGEAHHRAEAGGIGQGVLPADPSPPPVRVAVGGPSGRVAPELEQLRRSWAGSRATRGPRPSAAEPPRRRDSRRQRGTPARAPWPARGAATTPRSRCWRRASTPSARSPHHPLRARCAACHRTPRARSRRPWSSCIGRR